MAAYQCPNCDYVYDEATGAPQQGYPPGTSWDSVEDGWPCPDCGVREKFDFDPKRVRSKTGAERDAH
ncbi:rubredoxin [Mycobacterium sp. Z3061]|uniref:rubredoxin n=1 Tax=Mycobacterium sp. Z3061 TaxID=3073562 RepID=UPI0028733F5F|nr:rubredoxin [Mycobacterium sp. Z3061]